MVRLTTVVFVFIILWTVCVPFWSLYMKDNTRIHREDIRDNDKRLGRGWTPWECVSSPRLPVNRRLLKSIVPTFKGLYEWGVQKPSNNDICAIYLGKAEGEEGLLQRLLDYGSDSGHKSHLWRALHTAGYKLMLRWRIVSNVTTRRLTAADRAKVQETAILIKVDYATNLAENGKKCCRQPRGIPIQDVDFRTTDMLRRSARIAAANKKKEEEKAVSRKSSTINVWKGVRCGPLRKDGHPDMRYKINKELFA